MQLSLIKRWSQLPTKSDKKSNKMIGNDRKPNETQQDGAPHDEKSEDDRRFTRRQRVQIRSGRHNTNDSMAPVASPGAPAPLPARQALLPEKRTSVNESPLQSYPHKLMTVT